MRGTIIHWDPAGASGIISDASGRRLQFTRGDWRAAEEPVAGREVDFELHADRPSDIFVLPGQPSNLTLGGRSEAERQAETYGIISLVCAGVALLLGPLGFIAAIPAIIFGKKGKELGAGLRDRTGHNLGTAGFILGWIVAGLSLAFILFFVVFFGAILSTIPLR